MTDPPIPLRLKLPYASEEEFLAKVGASLAQGSMFVGTRKPKPEGTRIAFEFVLADGARVLAGQGRVTALSTDPARPGMTLSLDTLDPHSRELVARAATSRPSADPSADPSVEEQKHRRQAAVLDAPAPGQIHAEKGAILGIDLGTTICRAAVWQGDEVRLLPLEGRNSSLPSVVAFDDKGRLIVGTRAKAQVLVDPKSAVFGAKRFIGRRARSRRVKDMAARFPYEVCGDDHGDTAVRVQGRVIPVPEVASYLLAEIRNRASDALGAPTHRAVIGVPAYFNDRQRQAVRYAGQLAGLEVLRVVSEPTAVAIAFGFSKGLARKRLLVYDLGGGTFDASILEATGDEFEVAAAGGDNFLGGLDFDARVANWLEERFLQIQQFALPTDPLTRQRVRDAAEMAKIALSDRVETRVHVPFVTTRHNNPVDLDVPMPRTQFEALTGDLVERSLAVVRSVFEAAQLPLSAVDEVLLVGGQSQSPCVRVALERLVGKRARHDVDPHASVAIGAALVGHALSEQGGAGALNYTDVLSSAISVATSRNSFERVLDRGARLPCEKVLALTADRDGRVTLAVFQGDVPNLEENDFLGELEIDAAPDASLDISFSVSRDGVLAIGAQDGDGVRRELLLATADASAATREELSSAPPPTLEERKGMFQRLFGRR